MAVEAASIIPIFILGKQKGLISKEIKPLHYHFAEMSQSKLLSVGNEPSAPLS